jgi:hypothetical protein
MSRRLRLPRAVPVFHVAKQRATKQPGFEVNDNLSRTQTLFIWYLLAELYVPLEQPEIHRPAEA